MGQPKKRNFQKDGKKGSTKRTALWQPRGQRFPKQCLKTEMGEGGREKINRIPVGFAHMHKCLVLLETWQ